MATIRNAGRGVRPILMGLAGLAVLAGSALAHMPYLLPAQFDVGKRGHISVEASFSDHVFIPDITMRDAPFHMLAPDGSRAEVGPVTHLRDLAVFEADLAQDGTYRLTTGLRLGRKGRMYRADGGWRMAGEGGRAPEGVELVAVQSVTLAEAYVTRGRPTDGVLQPRGEGLEIVALTHPGRLSSGADAIFRVLFDGEPLAEAPVTLHRGAGGGDAGKGTQQAKTDSDGRVILRPDVAGTYLILVRHRTRAPADAETPYRSYTYTLTFDAP